MSMYPKIMLRSAPAMNLTEMRKKKGLPYLGPDGKAQVMPTPGGYR